MDFDTWLSKEEIKSMCRAKTKALVIKFLLDNGIKHYKDRNGWPVVARAVALANGALPPKTLPGEWKSNKAA